MGRILELAEDEPQFGQHQVEAGAEARAVAQFHHGAVEFHIDGSDPLPIVLPACRLSLFDQHPHPRKGGMSFIRRLYGPFLDDRAHAVDVDDGRFVRRGDEDAAIGDVHQQALAGQQPVNLPQRVARDAEPVGNVLLRKLFPRRELAGDQQVADARRHGFGKRPVVGAQRLFRRHFVPAGWRAAFRCKSILLNNHNRVIQQ